MKKKTLSPEQLEDAMRLKNIFESKKKELGFSQESIAHELGMRQSGVAQLLNGVNPLNMSNAAKFAKLLGVCVNDFSPMLAEKIAEVSESIKPAQTRHLSREEERLLDMFSSLPKRDKEMFLSKISERKDEVDQLFEEIMEARKKFKIN